MYPNRFEYCRPGSLPEAVGLMARYGDEARPLAGGQSLIPLMKLRVASPAVLVDLNRVPALAYLRADDGWLALGALVRHADVEEAPLVRTRLPLVADAVATVGDVQVRNLGTVAGALAEADPGGDWGPALLALGGELRCVGPDGERAVDAADFFTDFFTTALAPTEIIAEVRLRLPPEGSGGAYLKLERRAGDFAVVGVAVQLTLAPDGTCRAIGIGLSGVGPTPVKAAAAEAVLRGSTLDAWAIAEAARCLDAAIDPWTDRRGPAEYKRAMAGVLFRRALARARERATLAPAAAPDGT